MPRVSFLSLAGAFASFVSLSAADRVPRGSIVFASVGRRQYDFDVFVQDVSIAPQETKATGFLKAPSPVSSTTERRVTDGVSANCNARWDPNDPQKSRFVFVSERDGEMELYTSTTTAVDENAPPTRLTFAFGLDDSPVFPPVGPLAGDMYFISTRQESPDAYHEGGVAWNQIFRLEQPIVNGTVSASMAAPVRVSPECTPESCNAYYSLATCTCGGRIAYLKGSGATGQADIYHSRLNTSSGEIRFETETKVASEAGWPYFGESGCDLFFHALRDHPLRPNKKFWGVYYTNHCKSSPPVLLTEADTDVTTPSVSFDGLRMAASVSSDATDGFRQIILFDLQYEDTSYDGIEGTIKVPKVVSSRILTTAPTHHYNPSLRRDGEAVLYHKCRHASSIETGEKESAPVIPNLQSVATPDDLTELDLLRSVGGFPTYSPSGDRIAVNPEGFGGVAVMTPEGGELETVTKTKEGAGGAQAFSVAFEPHDKDRETNGQLMASSLGSTFASEKAQVDVVLFHQEKEKEEAAEVSDSSQTGLCVLTGGLEGNAAFPVFLPPKGDGRVRVVFRSAHEGFKNLYLATVERSVVEDCLESAEGKEGKRETMDVESFSLVRLTEGNWTDTMPAVSPDGSLLVFSSTRGSPPGEEGTWFELWGIRMDDPQLEAFPVFSSSSAETEGEGKKKRKRVRSTHPQFPPEDVGGPGGSLLVFASDFAGYSAEEVSLPKQFQPYGDIFVLDMEKAKEGKGKGRGGFWRLTHNPYENGTPAWRQQRTPASSLSTEGVECAKCAFEDSLGWIAKNTKTTKFTQQAVEQAQTEADTPSTENAGSPQLTTTCA
uniref:Dipeptidylpeptidase IV N-terminal domain-containing protein n=1 Tax=Chromera velia CCMP2878 TaxID=1169474 RepID=A0A0G4H2D2_9ALVE|mmetsp:Transcript_7547/g.14702  ORF Transcript_7547/g.14702 Transcript_7547/m.14702 type:complete len:831 (+) Transcript_7547:55-2547(+)|eukprot:Cvel_5587.t1-p1 / transcript=Cvel_5587.t1 / gene=Cvel_5587 / organism=Chromera_velia_CCMP2878 / gene_product=hypothetical protein / transcript_product=hypothetical protein / location=Cvel_scaffold262:100969-104311(+) / protein_length=830 / sequence_SO=supercontig / SO=protein_coding / is_pseudo=false